MTPLSVTGIIASVRPDGSLGPYQTKTYELMLCATDHPDKQIREAKRILRQIGLQVRRAEFEPNPGN